MAGMHLGGDVVGRKDGLQTSNLFPSSEKEGYSRIKMWANRGENDRSNKKK